LSKIVIYSFLVLLAYYGFLVLTLIKGETLVTLEWVPQTFVQSVIPIGAVLFIIAETIRIPKDYKQNVLQVKEETEREELI
jgi:TRAP-type C4-dicarboxylate transport system permease small subunit